MTLLPLLGFQQGVSGVLQGIHNSNKSGPELGKCLTVSPEIDPSTSVRPDQAGILIVINGHCDVVSRERGIAIIPVGLSVGGNGEKNQNKRREECFHGPNRHKTLNSVQEK